MSFLIAQKKDKWGLIRLDGTAITPFAYDYAGYIRESSVAMVKGSHANIFNEFFEKIR